MTSTQHVRVEGSSYERGCQYGRQAAARIRLSVQAYQQIAKHVFWSCRAGMPKTVRAGGSQRQICTSDDGLSNRMCGHADRYSFSSSRNRERKTRVPR